MAAARRLNGQDLAALQARGPAALSGVLRDEFRLWLAASQYAEATQETYYKRARGYLKWLIATQAHPEALSDSPARDHAITDYLQTAVPATHNVTLAAIRALYDWFDLGPVLVDSVNVDQVIPHTLTQDEQHRLLDAAAARSARDYALIVLALETGPRSSELRCLDIDDILLSARAGRVQLTAPDGQQRTIELSRATTWVLMGWRTERRALLRKSSSERALFISLSRHRRIEQDASLTYIVSSIGRAAGITRPLTPSALRATVEQRLLATGLDSTTVAARMGQTSINTSRIRALTSGHHTPPSARRSRHCPITTGQLSLNYAV